MKYDVEKLFGFEEIEGGLRLTGYAPDLFFEPFLISEITIPSEHDGLPVIEIGKDAFTSAFSLNTVTVEEGIRQIGEEAFAYCRGLRFVSLPASLERLGEKAFISCENLCDVEFKSSPIFGEDVFIDDLKLRAEIYLAGLVCSTDITRPLEENTLRKQADILKRRKRAGRKADFFPWSRPDVFALAAENDCFREISAEILDDFIECSARENLTEVTAYFLELKKRKFGFKDNGEFDI